MRTWLLFLLVLITPLAWADTQSKDFTFDGADYFHRWSGGDQKEFTPKGQDNLDKWQDMVTLLRFTKITNAEQMATKANAVLGAYQQNGAQVFGTNSEPATDKRPAAYFMMVAFARSDFIELVFARFKLVDGTGTGTVYSHRIYSQDQEAADQANAWMAANSAAKSKALMAWPFPTATYQSR